MNFNKLFIILILYTLLVIQSNCNPISISKRDILDPRYY